MTDSRNCSQTSVLFLVIVCPWKYNFGLDLGVILQSSTFFCCIISQNQVYDMGNGVLFNTDDALGENESKQTPWLNFNSYFISITYLLLDKDTYL